MFNAGYRAIDSLSIEKGYPHWHQEIRMDDSPVEAGLMFTTKLKTDTDFLGRAALEQRRAAGARRKKVCFTVDSSEGVCLVGLEAIVRNGEYVGHVTTSAPRLTKILCCAHAPPTQLKIFIFMYEKCISYQLYFRFLVFNL